MALSTLLSIAHISRDFSIDRMNDPAWDGACRVLVSEYWSGEAAASGREFSASLVWSETALYVRFEATQSEPLVVNDIPDISTKTLGLWDRDVCEIFIAPNRAEPNRYLEFEVAPTGEWIDLAIDCTSGERITDWEYRSGMESAAVIKTGRVLMAICVPWAAFGKMPKPGDIWLGNLFRCVGEGKTRGYLSWQATDTAEPNFHVPSRFGEFEFVK